MAASDKQLGQHYEALKQRLWNQPRPRQFMERLERHGARPGLLERVASLFVSGKHGEAEILAAIYYDLLRHQDRTDVLRRMACLRVVCFQIQQDLIFLANELARVKGRTACCHRKLGLSDRIMGTLIAIRPGPSASLDWLLGRLSEEYSQVPQSPTGNTEAGSRGTPALVFELRRILHLKVLLSRLHQNLLHLVRELDQLEGWKAYRTAGYGGFYEFTHKMLGLSGKVTGMLLTARQQACPSSPGELLHLIIKGYVASSDQAREVT